MFPSLKITINVLSGKNFLALNRPLGDSRLYLFQHLKDGFSIGFDWNVEVFFDQVKWFCLLISRPNSDFHSKKLKILFLDRSVFRLFLIPNSLNGKFNFYKIQDGYQNINTGQLEFYQYRVSNFFGLYGEGNKNQFLKNWLFRPINRRASGTIIIEKFNRKDRQGLRKGL